MNPNELTPRVSRRDFLAGATAVGLGLNGVAAGAEPASSIEDSTIPKWDHEVDLLVCGAGAGGLTAAVCAASRGKNVLLLEKSSVIGGTSMKASVIWIPDNPLMRADGRADPRPQALAYMARCARPELFDPGLKDYGLPADEYALLEAYYDHGKEMTAELVRLGAINVAYWRKHGQPAPDYYAHLPENKNVIGRALSMLDAAGTDTQGAYIIQMSQVGARLGVVTLREHQAVRLVTKGGRVTGLLARNCERSVACRARLGVVFATGGFTHNPTLASNFLRGPIFGGCAVPTNTGDFVGIAAQVDAALGNMNQAWWSEVVIEQALGFASVASSVFNLPGDSMLAVNRLGKRFYNEHGLYNERSQAHFYWDSNLASYPNLISFMIYDERVAKNPVAGYPYPVPAPGFSAPYVITGKDIPDLAAKLADRLKSLAGKMSVSARISSNFELAPDFVDSLNTTIRRFDAYAKKGEDPDFHRGQLASDIYFASNFPPGNRPYNGLHPLSDHGPYHCIIIGPGTLDTKGGPLTNARAQVLNSAGEVVAGLYGTGNCVASPARQAYWSGGSTVGASMTFGYLAAVDACASG
jgi:3-oxosteroid 1-dehydrogenase